LLIVHVKEKLISTMNVNDEATINVASTTTTTTTITTEAAAAIDEEQSDDTEADLLHIGTSE
jgi:hypothetical protein